MKSTTTIIATTTWFEIVRSLKQMNQQWMLNGKKLATFDSIVRHILNAEPETTGSSFATGELNSTYVEQLQI